MLGGMRVCVRFVGRVQGVGFRATTRQIARGLGATGWVRNEPDGSVLAELQGSAESVAEALLGVRERFVRNLIAEDSFAIPDIAGEHDFEVRR